MLKKVYLVQKSFLLFKTKIDSNTDPFELLKKGNTLTDDTNITGTAASGYNVLLHIGIIGIFISLIIGAIALIHANNANALSEAKKQICIKIGIGILIFAFTYIVGIIFNIVNCF